LGRHALPATAWSIRGRCRCRNWIPGVIGPETIVWTATAIRTSRSTRQSTAWEIYDKVTIEAGFTPGPDYHGMLKQIHVAETQEKALKNAA